MIHDDPISHAPSLHSPSGKRSPATRIVLLLLLAVAVVGTVWILKERSRKATAAAADAAKAATDRVIPVLTAQVTQRDVPITREGLGNVAAFYTVTVKPQVDGRIDKVQFTEGQRVKKGDLLVQIDPRPFAIQLQSAQAALARDQANATNAKLNLDRYKTLSGQNLIAVQQYTDQASAAAQADAQVQADQAQIGSARLNLDYARITSPIDGVVGVRLVDPGNVVHATDTGGLVVVTQLDPIAVLFTLPEDDLADVTKAMAEGTPTVVALSRDGDQLLGQGALSVLDNQINQATATIRLKAIFDNSKQRLWPNQFVKARLTLGTRKNAVVVPAVAIQHGPQGTFVYVVSSDSKATPRPIESNTIERDTAIISKGLTAGEQVVVEGQAQLRPGARVATKPATATTPSGSATPPEATP
jgi:multidrug efflux system membrane fusion protein